MSFAPPADLIEETSTTTGTGDYALGGATTGNNTFGSWFVDGQILPYIAVDGAGGFEAGFGRYNTANTLTRVIVFNSSNAGSEVSWAAGTRRIRHSVNSISGVMACQRHEVVTAAMTPGNTEDESSGYQALSHLIDQVNKRAFLCITGAPAGSAVWHELLTNNNLRIHEGSNAAMGTATLTAGSVVVSNTRVTATSRIFLTSQLDGGTPGWLRVSARTTGTSFTITSSSNTDTSTVAYLIAEPSA